MIDDIRKRKYLELSAVRLCCVGLCCRRRHNETSAPSPSALLTPCHPAATPFFQVSKKLSELVLEHHKEFMQELSVGATPPRRAAPRRDAAGRWPYPGCAALIVPPLSRFQRVSELEQQLSLAHVICKNERRHLGRASSGVHKGLHVLHQHRKKQQLLTLVKTLRAISIMRTADSRLSELLEAGQFLKAIEVRCGAAAGSQGGGGSEDDVTKTVHRVQQAQTSRSRGGRRKSPGEYMARQGTGAMPGRARRGTLGGKEGPYPSPPPHAHLAHQPPWPHSPAAVALVRADGARLSRVQLRRRARVQL